MIIYTPLVDIPISIQALTQHIVKGDTDCLSGNQVSDTGATALSIYLHKAKTLANKSISSIVFPKDAAVLDVTSFGALPNDSSDDTAAIQQALNEEASGNRIIYLPEGTYLVSDQLNWPAGNNSGQAHKRTILQGQNQDKTIIKLQDNATGYQNPEVPKPVVWTGKAPAQRFRNAIRNLTISTGSQNPGAIGMQFIANNQGGLRNVTISSEDGQGVIGLDMAYSGEIGPLLAKNIRISGFDYGIKTSWQTASITFQNITLENQNILGWENFGQALFIHGLRSINTVPVLKSLKNSPGHVVLVDAELTATGDATNQSAILNENSMFLRNIKTSGYGMAVNHNDKGRGNEPGVFAPVINEWLSHGTQPQALFESPNTSLNLPIQMIPEVSWDPVTQWVSPMAFGGFPDDNIDDTAAIQAAIDSGASTVYLPNGNWEISSSLEIRANVQRFIGTEAKLNSETGAEIRISDYNQPVVRIERLEIAGGNINILNNSDQTVVLSSLILSGQYTNTGNGDIFIEDVAGGPFYFKEQTVLAWQLNPETDTQKTQKDAKIVNDGGDLWIFGLKTERPGTVIKTMNGGQSEVLGGYIFSTGDEKIDPAFVSIDSSLSLAGVVERNFNGNRFQTWVSESRDGSTRTLGTDERNRTPLYVGY